MTKRHKATTKITAVVLTLLIVISAFSGIDIFSVFALSNKDYTVVTADSPAKLATQSDTCVPVGAATAAFTKDGGATYEKVAIKDPDNIIDSSHEKESTINYYNAPYYDINSGYRSYSKDVAAIGTWYIDGSLRRLNITVPLKFATNIKDIVVGNHATNAVIRTGKFEVFASVNESDLFSAENSVATIDNTASGLNAQRIIDIQVKNNRLQNRKFVGISIYQPISTLNYTEYESLVIKNGADILYSRLFGISVWGNYAKVTLERDDTAASMPSNIGEKVFDEATATMYRKGVITISEPMTEGNESYRTVDGDASTTPNYMAVNNAWRYILEDQKSEWSTTDAAVRQKFFDDNPDTYTTFTFKITKNFKPEKLLFIGRLGSGITTAKYEIYASSKESELYGESNRIYTYVNDENNAKRRQIYSLNSLEGVEVNYIGFKVLIPVMPKEIKYTHDYVVARITEIGVYGSFFRDDVTVEEADSAIAPNENSVVYAANAYYFDGTTRKPIANSNKSNWYDNNLSTAAEGSFDTTPFAVEGSNPVSFYSNRYVDIVHTLKGTATVNKILVYNHPDADLMTAEYSLYAGNDLDNLFTDSNKLCSYKNSSQKRAQTFSFPNTTAKYVAMRISMALRTEGYNAEGAAANPLNAYFRLYEFNAYGTRGSDYEPARELENASVSVIPQGTNVLSGMTADVMTVNSKLKVSAGGCSNVERLTDGELGADCYVGNRGSNLYFATNDMNGNKTWIGNGIEEGTIYSNFTFTFADKKATVERLFIAHHSSEGLRTKKFEVYVSSRSDAASLYKNDNLVKTVNNTGARRSTTIVFDTPIENVRCIGIRVLDPCCTPYWTNYGVGHEIYPRFSEIVAIGSTVDIPVEFSEVTRSSSDALPAGVDLSSKTDLVKNTIAPKIVVHEVGEIDGEEFAYEYACSEISKMHDDDLATQATPFTKFGKFNTETGTAQYRNTAESGRMVANSTYVDIYYDLTEQILLDNIKLAFPSDTIWALGRYDVHVGNSESTLYNEENRYVSVNNVEAFNEGNGDQTRMNVICFDRENRFNDCRGRYVGIRIYDPTCTTGFGKGIVNQNQNHLYPRIHAFQVYGKVFDTNMFESTTKSAFVAELKNVASGKLNLLQSATMYVYDQSGRVATPVSSAITKINTVIRTFDGSQTHNDLNYEPFNSDGFGLAFKINKYKTAQLDGFAYQGLTSNSTGYWPGKYELYMSGELKTLWNEESKVYEHNADEKGLSRAQIIEFPSSRKPKGSYFGIKFVDINHAAVPHDYFRLSYISMWGAEALYDAHLDNLAENMPIEASCVNGSERTAIGEDKLSATALKMLTDGNKTTFADINNSVDGCGTAELIYNLCNDAYVDKISVTALVNSSVGFNKMKVYTSSSYNGLFNDDALVWSCSAAYKTGTLTFTKAFAKQKYMRYVRLCLEEAKPQLRLFEIEVIGMDNQKMKTKSLTKDWNNSSISVIRTDKATNEQSTIAIHKNLVEALYDGEQSTYFSVNDGPINDAKIDLMIDLGGIKTVNRIDFSFLKRFKDYWPTKLNIYFGESKNDVFEATAPYCTINTAGIDEKVGTWSKDIRPIVAHYMRVEVAEFNRNEIYKDPNGRYLITFIISDISLSGSDASAEPARNEPASSSNSSKASVLPTGFDINAPASPAGSPIACAKFCGATDNRTDRPKKDCLDFTKSEPPYKSTRQISVAANIFKKQSRFSQATYIRSPRCIA